MHQWPRHGHQPPKRQQMAVRDNRFVHGSNINYYPDTRFRLANWRPSAPHLDDNTANGSALTHIRLTEHKPRQLSMMDRERLLTNRHEINNSARPQLFHPQPLACPTMPSFFADSVEYSTEEASLFNTRGQVFGEPKAAHVAPLDIPNTDSSDINPIKKESFIAPKLQTAVDTKQYQPVRHDDWTKLEIPDDDGIDEEATSPMTVGSSSLGPFTPVTTDGDLGFPDVALRRSSQDISSSFDSVYGHPLASTYQPLTKPLSEFQYEYGNGVYGFRQYVQPACSCADHCTNAITTIDPIGHVSLRDVQTFGPTRPSSTEVPIADHAEATDAYDYNAFAYGHGQRDLDLTDNESLDNSNKYTFGSFSTSFSEQDDAASMPSTPSSFHNEPETSTEEVAAAKPEHLDEHERSDSEPRAAIERHERDEYLLAMRAQGLPYAEIKRLGRFAEKESTLRGRVRALTKAPSERVRKPIWTKHDVALLRRAVAHHKRLQSAGRSGRGRGEHLPWKVIAEWIKAHGGSYLFAPGTCKKKFLEIGGHL